MEGTINSAVGIADGRLKVWMDGNLVADIIGLDA
jgi:hypothetical protein